MRLDSIFAGLVGAYIAFTPISAAQSVEDQLAQIEKTATEQAQKNGATLTKVFEKKWYLGGDEGVDIDLNELEDFENYLVVGVCDIDCSALGLTVKSASITNPSEIEIDAQDISGTDLPAIEFFMVPMVREYTLNVSMMACTTTICEYAVDIYRLDR